MKGGKNKMEKKKILKPEKDYLDDFPKEPRVIYLKGRPKKCFYCKKNDQDGVWGDSLLGREHTPICKKCLQEKTSEAKKLIRKARRKKIFG